MCALRPPIYMPNILCWDLRGPCTRADLSKSWPYTAIVCSGTWDARDRFGIQDYVIQYTGRWYVFHACPRVAYMITEPWRSLSSVGMPCMLENVAGGDCSDGSERSRCPATQDILPVRHCTAARPCMAIWPPDKAAGPPYMASRRLQAMHDYVL